MMRTILTVFVAAVSVAYCQMEQQAASPSVVSAIVITTAQDEDSEIRFGGSGWAGSALLALSEPSGRWVARASTQTLYVRWGDWWVYGCLGVVVLGLVLGWRWRWQQEPPFWLRI